MIDRQIVEARIREKLLQAGIEPETVRVAPDSYYGWRIAVVADAFAEYQVSERRAMVRIDLDEPVAWQVLATPEELKESGLEEDPLNLETPELPLWPEAMSRGRLYERSRPLYPSDLERDINPPITMTFYSLRGGVGRSTALAYTAGLLAAQGRKVVCVDMNLEAPGLAALFGVEERVSVGKGAANLLLDFDMGAEPDVTEHLVPLNEEGNLFLLPAGLPDAEYARTLRELEPAAWYREDAPNPLRSLLDGVRKQLPFRPDVVLLDARTGISALSAPLLFEQADLAVIVFFPHPQAKTGTETLVRALSVAQTWRTVPHDGESRHLTPEPRFVVSPLPPRDAGQHHRDRALAWITEWLGLEEQDLEAEEVTHFVTYSEALAVC